MAGMCVGGLCEGVAGAGERTGLGDDGGEVRTLDDFAADHDEAFVEAGAAASKTVAQVAPRVEEELALFQRAWVVHAEADGAGAVVHAHFIVPRRVWNPSVMNDALRIGLYGMA